MPTTSPATGDCHHKTCYGLARNLCAHACLAIRRAALILFLGNDVRVIMAYRLNIHDELGPSLCRIIREQIDRALKELSAKSAKPENIHESRKCFKRIRAVLKLIKPGLHDTYYKTENTRFRDIARELSPARDRDVLKQTLFQLDCIDQRTPSSLATEIGALIDKRIGKAGGMRKDFIERACDKLSEATCFYREQNLEGLAPVTLEAGLRKCYGRARTGQKQAFKNCEDEDFHEWRKYVQLHWRHMSLFREAWPEFFRARVELARQLSQLLGNDHDLSMLMNFLHAATNDGEIKKANARNIIKRAQFQQNALRTLAKPVSTILFQEAAKTHAKHIVGIWLASKKISTENHTTSSPKYDKDEQSASHPATTVTT